MTLLMPTWPNAGVHALTEALKQALKQANMQDIKQASEQAPIWCSNASCLSQALCTAIPAMKLPQGYTHLRPPVFYRWTVTSAQYYEWMVDYDWLQIMQRSTES